MAEFRGARRFREADYFNRLRVTALATVITGVALLSIAAFMISYTAIDQIALTAGATPRLAALYALIVDTMLVVTLAAALALREAAWWMRYYAWLSLLALLAAVAIADAIHSAGFSFPQRAMAVSGAVLPWVLMLLGFGLWLMMLRHLRSFRTVSQQNVIRRESEPADRARTPARVDDGQSAWFPFWDDVRESQIADPETPDVRVIPAQTEPASPAETWDTPDAQVKATKTEAHNPMPGGARHAGQVRERTPGVSRPQARNDHGSMIKSPYAIPTPGRVLYWCWTGTRTWGDAMSQYPDELGAWWTGFPGSDRATWAAPSMSSPGALAPAHDGVRGAVARRALKHGLVVTPGKRERARREQAAQWQRQVITAIREPSLKSGVITVGSGFGGTGKTDVAVTLAAIYAAARPADRVILADSNDDMPHGYIRLGGLPVEDMPQHQRTLSIRGFYQACTEGRIKAYADLRDAVAWLQGVAVIRGDTADECVGVDFGEQEYQAVLEFLQCMSNIVINDGGTGLFAKLQVGTLLHGDKYIFVTEASRLGFWSIGQVFSRYRNYEGEKERPLTEQERKHLNGLMDEATVVVDKFSDSDPEQARWLAQIRDSFEGTQVSVVATPWDQALANRVPLDLGAVAGPTLDAKLAMAEEVLRGVDRANRRRQGLPERETEDTGHGLSGPPEPPRWLSQPLPPVDGPDAEPDTPAVRILAAQPSPHSAAAGPVAAAAATDNPDRWPDSPAVRIIPAQSAPHTEPPQGLPDTPDVRITRAPSESNTDTEPGTMPNGRDRS